MTICTKWSKFELVPDYTPVLETCKFEKVGIKTDVHFPGQSKVCLFSTQGQVTLRKLYYMAEIQTLLKFYACPRKLQWEKSCDQNLRSYPLDKVKHGLFQPLRASDSKTNTKIWPKFELAQAWMPASLKALFSGQSQIWAILALKGKSF